MTEWHYDENVETDSFYEPADDYDPNRPKRGFKSITKISRQQIEEEDDSDDLYWDHDNR